MPTPGRRTVPELCQAAPYAAGRGRSGRHHPLFEKDDAVVEYAIGDIRAKVFASKYLTNLPDKETLRQEILNTQRALAGHVAERRGLNPAPR